MNISPSLFCLNLFIVRLCLISSLHLLISTYRKKYAKNAASKYLWLFLSSRFRFMTQCRRKNTRRHPLRARLFSQPRISQRKTNLTGHFHWGCISFACPRWRFEYAIDPLDKDEMKPRDLELIILRFILFV